jgi:formylmethanofuran dehydrogenase subunit E
VSVRAGSEAFRDARTWELYDRIEDDTATAAERRLFAELQAARAERILTAPVEELLTVAEIQGDLPQRHRLAPSAPCDGCAEQTSTAILHDHRGRMLCPPCHLDAHGGVLPEGHADHHHSHDHDHGHDHARHR